MCNLVKCNSEVRIKMEVNLVRFSGDPLPYYHVFLPLICVDTWNDKKRSATTC